MYNMTNQNYEPGREQQNPIGEYVTGGLKTRIDEVLSTLTDREKEIIKLRYGLGDGQVYTIEEAGKIFQVTRERVRQIEARAIRKLQHPVRVRKLEGFLDDFQRKLDNETGSERDES